MADWRDVMEARGHAEDAVLAVDAYGGRIEDGGESNAALATLLAARAIALELRAFGIVVDYAARYTDAT